MNSKRTSSMRSTASSSQGFTIMEIMIALAILGLIVAMVVPSIGPIRTEFALRAVMKDARDLKGIVAQFVDAYGPPPITEGLRDVDRATYISGTDFAGSDAAAVSGALRFDMALTGASLMEKFFSSRLGESLPTPAGYQAAAISYNPTLKRFVCSPDTAVTAAGHGWAGIHRMECVRVAPGNPDPSTVQGTNFWLQGDRDRGLSVGTRAISLVLEGMSATDAFKLAEKANPEFLDAAVPGGAQSRGTVIFGTPDPDTGLTTVRVYVWHG
jgi:prepilin-type N-terminal cleavage/methylation domain-containing protein